MLSSFKLQFLIFQVLYRRPNNDSRHLWLRSAVIVFFIMVMRILQQQAEAQEPEMFQPLVIRVVPPASSLY